MKKLDITKYKIKDKKIDHNLNIMFLSDLHNRDIIEELNKEINSLNPDLIILGGDMINQYTSDMNYFYKLCSLLKNRIVYYTFGNHEEMLGENDLEEYKNTITNYGIEILNNKSINISKNIILHGFDSELECYKKFRKQGINKKYIEDKVGIFDKSKFNILIAHNPLEFNSYMKTNSDLVLSGHVHGGLIMIPGIGALLSPDYTLFPKYYDGMYEKNNTKMIVSRGIGLSKRIPIRVFNNPEIVMIELVKDK